MCDLNSLEATRHLIRIIQNLESAQAITVLMGRAMDDSTDVLLAPALIGALEHCLRHAMDAYEDLGV